MLAIAFFKGFIFSLSLCCDLGIVNVAMIQTGIERGAKRSFQLGFGSCFGDLTYLTLALLGVTVIFQIPFVRWVLWIGGTLVLGWLTVQMVRKALKEQSVQLQAELKKGNEFWWGLGLALSSPTVILWFAVVAGPIIASLGVQDVRTTIVFVAGFFVAGLAWSAFIALAAGASRRWSSTRFVRVLSIISAAMFCFLAVKIFMDGWQNLFHSPV
ncbi:LysE family translocator [Paenibacillus hexagrammi]|uniref:LysE family translocator n=1 Tax=Paenibacillus hexagrammi TaxID=2908839 RepID=A0ABY3SFE2_9BACL|nr:LysE family transporter [Paenibacillus sp. YPD9-1]UJF32150.1 LysE family translocator [Paenibacillus sp. YPD9-1]